MPTTALSIECPTCKAAPGAACTMTQAKDPARNGLWRTTHQSRVTAFTGVKLTGQGHR